MRLRPLSEAECYARCYGGRHGERVSVVRPLPRTGPPGERLRELAQRLVDRVREEEAA